MGVDDQWKLLEARESWKINLIKVEIFQVSGELYTKALKYDTMFHVWESSTEIWYGITSYARGVIANNNGPYV